MGLFISFEGGEGSGKTTQARALYRRLLKSEPLVVLTHEPGGTILGNRARRWLKGGTEVSPLSELLIFAAARAQLLAEVIRPALEKGAIVICDRYADSTTAYQGYGRRLDLDQIEQVNAIATQGLRPDLTILLDLKAKEGLGRLGPTRDRFEREELAFHRRLRQGYLKLAAQEPGRWLVLDATRPRKEVQRLIWERVKKLLPLNNTSSHFSPDVI